MNDTKTTNSKNVPVIQFNDIEVQKIEVDKNICIRVMDSNGNKYVDLRKFYKGYPTKRGIRLKYELFKDVVEALLNK